MDTSRKEQLSANLVIHTQNVVCYVPIYLKTDMNDVFRVSALFNQ